MGHCSCSRIAGLLELAIKWSASKDSVGGAIACVPTMIFCGCVWLDNCRPGDKSECKVNTNVLNVYLFTTIPHSQQQAAQVCNGIAELLHAEARRVSVNYVIAGVNSKDSVQVLADV